MARILVTEQLADACLDALRDAGHEVDVQLGLSPDQLLEAVPGARGLVVRSATQVTDEVLAAGRDLVIVGRAGLGVDNIDVDAATRRGVMVANAPGTNALSTAEHAMALLLGMARNVPQAAAALKEGRWEKSRWEGTELHGKTLGILGLGRIGTLVAQRANAFGMRLVAWDPWVSPERARQLGIELLELDQVAAESDFVTVHLVKMPQYIGIIGRDFLAKAKPGMRVVNDARGGLVDEEALAEALTDGRVAGAALDVFETEPCTDSPLFGHDSVIATPHLGASTSEAQDKAGIVVAQQVILGLAGEFVPFAVNISASEADESIRPFVPLAERLGGLFASLHRESLASIELDYEGDIAAFDTRILTLSFLKGFFSGSDEAVSFVNAPQLAEERGIEVRETKTTSSHDYVNLIKVRGGEHALAGALFGLKGEPRIVALDGHDVELPLAAHLLVVRNDDRVGMMAKVTAAVAEAGVNIGDMRLGRSPGGGTALAVITSDEPIPSTVADALDGQPGILGVHIVSGG